MAKLTEMTQCGSRAHEVVEVLAGMGVAVAWVMKIYRNKVTGEFHTRLGDGTLSRGYASREELAHMIRKLQRNAAQRERYAAMRDCGMTKTPYGWE